MTTIDILYDSNIYNNSVILNNTYDPIDRPKFNWFNNPSTGMFNTSSNVLGFSINGIPELIITNSNVYAANFEGSGSNVTNIKWQNLINVPALFTSNVLGYLNSNYGFDTVEQRQVAVTNLSNIIINNKYVSSNVLAQQFYINSNSITDIVSFLISSNT